jgi:hypothetical protein
MIHSHFTTYPCLKEKVSSFAAKYNLPYKILLDKDGKVAYTYGVRGVSTKILIGENETILCRPCRSVDILVEMLLGNKSKDKSRVSLFGKTANGA